MRSNSLLLEPNHGAHPTRPRRSCMLARRSCTATKLLVCSPWRRASARPRRRCQGGTCAFWAILSRSRCACRTWWINFSLKRGAVRLSANLEKDYVIVRVWMQWCDCLSVSKGVRKRTRHGSTHNSANWPRCITTLLSTSKVLATILSLSWLICFQILFRNG